VTTAPPCAALCAPPSLQTLADRCVQCGLCLPVCPTYALDPIEAESPRGRIALIKAWESGLLAPSKSGDSRLDHCLGCRRCEAVCPAGVQYDVLLSGARDRQRERRPVSARQRALEWLTARPQALTAMMAAYRIVFPLLPRRLRPLPRPVRRNLPAINSGATAAKPFALFLGCVARSYESPLHTALFRLAKASGLEIVVPAKQTCCGSLHAHAGASDTADALAATNRAAFAQAGTVLSTASGCHDAIADSLRGITDVKDAIVAIAKRADSLRFAPRAERVALHLPCTQRSGIRSEEGLRALLARVPELEVVIIDAGLGCCGAAGTQMLTDPGRAARFRQPLLDQIAASGASRLLSANIGCRLHLGNGTSLLVQHPLEFLSECLA
jgi:glycolate oxidase iron-sulfur subunit